MLLRAFYFCTTVVYNLDPRVRFSFGHRGQSWWSVVQSCIHCGKDLILSLDQKAREFADLPLL